MKKSSSGIVRRSASLAQCQRRAERDQRRRHVSDRRAVGDVAADRAHVAHLVATDPVDQFPQRRNARRQRGEGIRVADACPDRDDAVLFLDRPQFVEMSDEDRRGDVAHELRHPEPDIGRSGDDRGIRLGFQNRREVVGISRDHEPLPARADLDSPPLLELGQPRRDRLPLSRHRIITGVAVSRDRPVPPSRWIRSRCSGTDCPAVPSRSRRPMAPACASTARRAT